MPRSTQGRHIPRRPRLTPNCRIDRQQSAHGDKGNQFAPSHQNRQLTSAHQSKGHLASLNPRMLVRYLDYEDTNPMLCNSVLWEATALITRPPIMGTDMTTAGTTHNTGRNRPKKRPKNALDGVDGVARRCKCKHDRKTAHAWAHEVPCSHQLGVDSPDQWTAASRCRRDQGRHPPAATVVSNQIKVEMPG